MKHYLNYQIMLHTIIMAEGLCSYVCVCASMCVRVHCMFNVLLCVRVCVCVCISIMQAVLFRLHSVMKANLSATLVSQDLYGCLKE